MKVSQLLRAESPSLSDLLYHFHDGCDGSLRLFNHDKVTAVICNELLAVSR